MILGISAALISCIFATSKDLVSKSVASHVNSSVSTFASFFFALPYYLIILAILWLLKIETFAVHGAFWGYIFIRALTDTGAEWSKMTALSKGDLSLVSIFMSLHPLILAIISPYITKDPLPTEGLIAVSVVVFGSVIFVANKSILQNKANLGAIAYALLASIFFALNNCMDRLAVQTGSPTFAGFVMTLLACIFIYPTFRTVGARNKQLSEQFCLFSLRGFFEVCFMVFKLFALQYLQAPYVAAIGRLSLLLSIFGGKMLFNEKDFLRRLIAGVVVVSGVVWIVLMQ